jgi:hypothetical protein
MSQAFATEAGRATSRAAWSTATVVAYVFLWAILCLTRLVGLGHSYWFDELYFVEHFVRLGPGQIIAGPNLSHELYGVLAWTTSTLVGESEAALRLWSVLPFLAGVAVVTAWLHTRLGALAGLLFVFLATVSPLLLDIGRQARGYGLAFFAMSVLIVAALEADRTKRTPAVVAACAAGAIGTWTLPQFGIAFVATGLVLVIDRELRRRAAVCLAVSIAAIGAWYAPHLQQIHAASQLHDGLRITTQWLVTAPLDQVLFPALIWIDGTVAVPGIVWLPLVVATGMIVASSPLVRERQPALILVSGVVATIVVLWIGRAHVLPRYMSFLLVPLFVLLASGGGSVLARVTTRPALVRTLVSVAAVGILAVRFVVIAPDVVRLPREAGRDAARIIEAQTPETTPVFAYMHLRESLSFYLDRPLHAVGASTSSRVCDQRPAVYVVEPFNFKLPRIDCLEGSDVRHYRFRQYARGNEIDVWFLPASS